MVGGTACPYEKELKYAVHLGFLGLFGDGLHEVLELEDVQDAFHIVSQDRKTHLGTDTHQAFAKEVISVHPSFHGAEGMFDQRFAQVQPVPVVRGRSPRVQKGGPAAIEPASRADVLAWCRWSAGAFVRCARRCNTDQLYDWNDPGR